MQITSALERKNNDLIKDSIRQVKADNKRREIESRKDTEDACKEAAGFLVRRAKGKQVFDMSCSGCKGLTRWHVWPCIGG